VSLDELDALDPVRVSLRVEETLEMARECGQIASYCSTSSVVTERAASSRFSNWSLSTARNSSAGSRLAFFVPLRSRPPPRAHPFGAGQEIRDAVQVIAIQLREQPDVLA